MPSTSPSSDVAARAAEAGRLEALSYRDIPYARLTDDVGPLRRGTVLVGGRLLPVYPSIGRIYALEKGVLRNFPERFWAEEKLDGYNVRIVKAEGRILAFTRGGFLCPFTTDRLPDLAELGPLLEACPDCALCAEVVGPGNPYIDVPSLHVEMDVGLFAFDLLRLEGGGFLPLDERDALFARHGVPRAPLLGIFGAQDWQALRETVLRLDALAVEGMVLKPRAEGLRVKYVTPAVNLSDIVEDATLLAELPASFFTSRLLRLVIGLDELGLWDRSGSVEARLGRALLEELRRTLEQVRHTGLVTRQFTVRLREPGSADLLLAHLNRASRSVQVHEVERRSSPPYHLLTFRKTYLHSTSYLKTLLSGESLIE